MISICSPSTLIMVPSFTHFRKHYWMMKASALITPPSAFALNQRLKPRSKFVNLILVLFQSGKDVVALGIENESGLNNALFGDVYAERVLFGEFLKGHLPFPCQNPIQKYFSGAGVWRRREQRCGIAAGANGGETFQKDGCHRQPLGCHCFAVHSA